MTEIEEKTSFLLCPVSDLDVAKTFDCGQCFRWNPDGRGGYSGVAGGIFARFWQDGENVYTDAREEDIPFWRDYLDFDTDYAAARASLNMSDYMRECADYGAGIRILRQDKWEALCSFIVSQCNNITRIKGIVERLCERLGEPVDDEGHFAFPAPEVIAPLEEGDLAFLRSGYRAPYIIAAARAVVSGEIDLEETAKLPGPQALAELKRLPGVGNKVANCVVLFGFHQMDAFPIDVWIKRVLRERFPADFKPGSLGPYAGLAQQYMFYHARSEGRS